MKKLAIICILDLPGLSAHTVSFEHGYYFDLYARKKEGLLQCVQGSFGLLFEKIGYLKFRKNDDSKTVSPNPDEVILQNNQILFTN